MTLDSELWQQIHRGNADAFELLYRENAPRLKAFLRHMVGNPQAAEDLMQETFTQLWRQPNRFQPERGSLRSYLFGIARKRAAEWWRAQDPQGREIETVKVAERGERAAVMADVFRRLPEEQRMLLWLREIEGQSYAELAEILDIPVGTVRSRLFAAREALRRIWSGGEFPKEGV